MIDDPPQKNSAAWANSTVPLARRHAIGGTANHIRFEVYKEEKPGGLASGVISSYGRT